MFAQFGRGLKNLDRTQSRFAATRELLIEGRESTSIAGYRRNMQRVGNIDTVCNSRKRYFDAFGVLDSHFRQPQRSFYRPCDGNVIEVVYRAQHPERLQQHSHAHPYVLGLKCGTRARPLCLVIIDK
jgi:hypothetical protein